jgi:hypothetical protein
MQTKRMLFAFRLLVLWGEPVESDRARKEEEDA